MERFQTLLESIVTNPTAELGELEMISGAERRAPLRIQFDCVEWPRNGFVHELFLEQAERSPDAVAVIHEEERLTYWNETSGLPDSPTICAGWASDRRW